jgi:glucose-1-phosphate cytidylyltransferase
LEKVIILAGGLGSRLGLETEKIPKPMVEIGSMPILIHIMKIYNHFGYTEFILPLGYKAEMIKNFFSSYQKIEDWKIDCIDTGLNTQTGGRIKRAMEFVGNHRVMVTYGDGLADIDISKLMSFHKKQKKLATVTAVRPPARFGRLDLEGDMVTHFAEKPQSGDGWINGGFFVLEPTVKDYIAGDEMPFESLPLMNLVFDKQLVSYKHKGFWKPMDTIREKKELNELWESKKAPWKIWE